MPTKSLNELRASGDFMAENAILKEFSETLVVSPQHWETYGSPVNLDWQCLRFTNASKAQIPNTFGGVYTFVVQPGIANHPRCSYLFYVGKAHKQSFRERYKQYLSYKKNKTGTNWYHITKMLNRWDGYLWFCYARIDQVDLIPAVERSLQDAYVPPYNKEFLGEVGPAVKAKL